MSQSVPCLRWLPPTLLSDFVSRPHAWILHLPRSRRGRCVMRSPKPFSGLRLPAVTCPVPSLQRHIVHCYLTVEVVWRKATVLVVSVTVRDPVRLLRICCDVVCRLLVRCWGTAAVLRRQHRRHPDRWIARQAARRECVSLLVYKRWSTLCSVQLVRPLLPHHHAPRPLAQSWYRSPSPHPLPYWLHFSSCSSSFSTWILCLFSQ